MHAKHELEYVVSSQVPSNGGSGDCVRLQYELPKEGYLVAHFVWAWQASDESRSSSMMHHNHLVVSPRMSYLAQVQHHPPLILRTLPIILLYQTRDRHVGQRGQPEGMPPGASLIVQCLRVLCDPLVPENYRSGLISHSAAEVLAAVDKVEQELQQIVRFVIVPAHDALRVAGVDEERLLAGHRVYCDHRVNGLGDPSSQICLSTVVAELSLHGLGGGVDGTEALETFPKGGRESFIGAGHLVYGIWISAFIKKKTSLWVFSVFHSRWR